MKNESIEIAIPEYILVEKAYNLEDARTCDCCGRAIHNVNVIKNTETKEVQELGTGCALNTLGKSVKDIGAETEEYEKAIKQKNFEDIEKARKKTVVQRFNEANPEMLEYIENNLHISFISSMKDRIEEYGTLTNSMFYAVYTMMLDVAQLPNKVQDLRVKAIRFTKKESQFGTVFTLFAETDTKELVRIYFSSMNDKNDNLFIEKGIYDKQGFISDNIYERDIYFTVKGSFDGYKLKRVKIEG
jgi:hypothetical protein